MVDMIPLASLRQGEDMLVLSVDGRDDIKQRFLDLGIDSGVEMSCVMQAPIGGIKAYRIRGAVIAIRDEDAEGILGRIVSCRSMGERL